MKSSIVIASLAVLGSSAAFAASSDTFFNGRSIYAAAAEAENAKATGDITKSEYLNIKCGDTITFVNGNKTFSWKFDVSEHRAVVLSKIAPTGFDAGSYRIYLDSNDMEQGG